MSFPRFSNPLLREQQYAVISRSDLLEYQSDGDFAVADPADVEKLDAIVKCTLELPVSAVSSGPPHKKRKHRHATLEQKVPLDVLVPFRLFSSAPVREYSLLPRPHPEINNEGPPCEDNELQGEARRVQAETAAVNVDYFLREGAMCVVRQKEDGKVAVKASLPSSPPALALLERPRNASLSKRHFSSPAQASSHETKLKVACPTLSFSVATSPSQSVALSETARRRLRRQKKRSHEQIAEPRAQARFYRPLLTYGRSNLGYAMGYEGSWAVEDEDERRRASYVRDGMKIAQWWKSALRQQ